MNDDAKIANGEIHVYQLVGASTKRTCANEKALGFETLRSVEMRLPGRPFSSTALLLKRIPTYSLVTRY